MHICSCRAKRRVAIFVIYTSKNVERNQISHTAGPSSWLTAIDLYCTGRRVVASHGLLRKRWKHLFACARNRFTRSTYFRACTGKSVSINPEKWL